MHVDGLIKTANRRLAITFVVALMLHLWMILGLDVGPLPVTRSQAVKLTVRPVAAPITKPETIKPKILRREAKLTSPAISSSQAKGSSEIDVKTTPSESKRSYASLLPKLETQGLLGLDIPSSAESDATGDDLIAASLGAKMAPDEQRGTDVLTSHINVPLEWRKINTSGKAIAILEYRKDDRKLWLRSLSGDPILRAVLFQFLKDPASVDQFKRVMALRLLTDFRVELRFRRETGAERTLNLADQVVVYERGVLITKTLPAPMRMFEGMPIEDEHARRAKRRDRLELSKLQESPAFQRMLTDVPLG